ncbi:LPS translocon maturation chaperone LptM [Thiomicrorhabdus lithotrophica]|uniref:Lipoprotein n=1 Tax=Thiomicrorhabdus lithotrophica TaxID=2949997 RepID=A0ABY8C8P4_9GAMM|nr:lipoprotein [Thiomicrorhabdus lithotrophica]WEJ62345.1 lipoprotein [Thiomicrorhabdus lithotrophica]
MRIPLFISLVLCSILLSACGKKGPLYLPEEPKEANNTQQSSLESNVLRIQPLENKLQQDKS